MDKNPPIKRVRWAKAYRIISSIFPPIDLFEDCADPADWELLARLEAKSNPRVVETLGQLSLVPVNRRVSGAGASYVMAPFTHISPRWQGRFHDGSFGAYYAANSLETALLETMHHRGRIYRASHEAPGWFCQFRELIGSVDQRFSDLRNDPEFAAALDPDDYGPSQSLARTLHQNGSNGIVYPSVRDKNKNGDPNEVKNGEGQCLCAFWPDVIGIPIQGRHFSYHFNGDRIDMVRDETSREVFRLA